MVQRFTNRHTFLRFGASLGILAGTDSIASPPVAAGTEQQPKRDAFRRLTPDPTRNSAPKPGLYDHPLRQHHNQVSGRRRRSSFNRKQRHILTDLLYSGLSRGRTRAHLRKTIRWTGVNFCKSDLVSPWRRHIKSSLLVLPEPASRREEPKGGLGGPQVYGDQRGNEVAGLPAT